MKTPIAVAACVGACLMVGCASTRQYVPLPDQTKRVEDSTKGRIYVMRPATVGAAISMNVSDDGKPIGSTGPHGFLCWERQPGDTIISGTSEGVSRAPLTVRAGDVYYIFQHLRMGLLIARNELEILGEEEGKKVLKRCKPPKVNLERVPPVQTTKGPGGT